MSELSLLIVFVDCVCCSFQTNNASSELSLLIVFVDCVCCSFKTNNASAFECCFLSENLKIVK